MFLTELIAKYFTGQAFDVQPVIPALGLRKNNTALANALQVKATPGVLINLVGLNDGASDQYIQLHDKASAPSAGEAPFLVIAVPAGEAFRLDIPQRFTKGLYVVNSTTTATYTAGAADCFFTAHVA